MTNTNNKFKISGFILKILGAVFMTLDHVGIFLGKYENLQEIANIFRGFGRIALPIFVLLIVEGIRHTKSFKNYLIRLTSLGFIFLIGQIIYFKVLKGDISNFYNPIIDLVLIAITIYLLDKKNRWSFLTILPLAYFVLDFVVINIEIQNMTTISFMPQYLRCGYPIYSVVLGLTFYYSKPIAKRILLSNQNTQNLVETEYFRYTENLINSLAILLFSLGFYVLFEICGVSYIFLKEQAYASLAFIPIMFYSGARGYNAKWFKYGAYLYFPLHIIFIYLIFVLI